MATLPADALLGAEEADPRRATRREFRCFVEARGAGGELRATIENLSRTGMLIDTPVSLRDGETITIELPNAGPIAAQVVWTYGTFAGCEFPSPLSQGAVSAALLFSPHLLAPREPAPTGRVPLEARVEQARQTTSAATGAAWFALALTAAMLVATLAPLAQG